VSKEGESFTLPISVAKMSKLVETTIDDENEDEVQEIPLPNVKSSILSKVIEYCTHYQTVEPMAPITLLDLTCFAVAVLIKGKSADDIRTIFNISSDYAPDEEVQAAEDTKWCEN